MQCREIQFYGDSLVRLASGQIEQVGNLSAADLIASAFESAKNDDKIGPEDMNQEFIIDSSVIRGTSR